MTAKQKAARAKFKAIVKEAGKLRKKNPKLTQAEAVKQAWAISYGKKIGYSKEREKLHKNATAWLKKRKKLDADKSKQDRISLAYQQAPFGKPGSVGAVKKKSATKIKATKRKATEQHTDTKSHNVNIRVVSGWKKGKTKFVEKGEARPKRNGILVKRKAGQFSAFKRISGMGNINDNKQLIQISKEDKLKAAVIRILKNKVKDYKGDYKTLFEDIMQGGLQSGIISELIYYRDTLAWYKKYRDEIMSMLKETMWELGANSPADVFGNKWDKSDPLGLDTNNQNLLAWYSFENTVYELANRLGYEL